MRYRVEYVSNREADEVTVRPAAMVAVDRKFGVESKALTSTEGQLYAIWSQVRADGPDPGPFDSWLADLADLPELLDSSGPTQPAPSAGSS